MEKLNKDELFRLAMEFDLPTLLEFCKRFNEKVGENNDIWYYRLQKRFPRLSFISSHCQITCINCYFPKKIFLKN
jgi:hypothetical protein